MSDGPQDALLDRLRQEASTRGLVLLGVTTGAPLTQDGENHARWLEGGMAGEMHYLASPRRDEPRLILSEAQSVVAFGLPYTRRRQASDNSGEAPEVAAYALGADYHTVLWDKLEELADWLGTALGRPVTSRICVDTAPLLERAIAARAGGGFVGKSTLFIVPGLGSDLVLGELLVDVPLPSGAPIRSRCGSCTACLAVCPTGALIDAYQLDARRCISYLTIEYRGVIPRELRPKIGLHLFGCDLCQTRCPFNASKRPRITLPELTPHPELMGPDPVAWLEMTSSDYRRLVRHTALRRTHRVQLKRNAAVVLGNLRDPATLAPLVRALEGEPSAVVRMHVAWALGRLGGTKARAALEATRRDDDDEGVRTEAQLALDEMDSDVAGSAATPSGEST